MGRSSLSSKYLNVKTITLIAALVVSIGCGCGLYQGPRPRPGSTTADAPRAVDVANPPVNSYNLRLSGTTESAHSFAVLAPQLEGAQLSTMIITSLIPDGAHVHGGEVLVQFDSQAQTNDFLEKQNKFSELAGKLAEKQSDEQIASAKDETELEQAESNYKKAELESQKNEIVSQIDAEKNRQAVDETRTALKQLKETFHLKLKAAAASIHILQLQCELAQQAMNYAKSNAAKMTIRSPLEGIAVRTSIWLNERMGTVQPGNQVNPGTSFMQVVDPSKMEVRVSVNQADVIKLQLGDHALIKPDAYPGMSLPAILAEISPLGQEGNFSDKIRVFSGRFTVLGTDSRLLPDLSVAVDLDLAKKAVPAGNSTARRD